MGDSALHFSDHSSSEQVSNGVQTGFVGSQLFEFLDELVSSWNESSRLDAQLLQAICRLSVDDSEQALQGFTSIDIASAMSQLRGRTWSSKDDSEQMSSDVRRQWSKLLVLWLTKEEGVRQALSDAGQQVVPLLRKAEGGGVGRPTKYRIEWVAAAVTLASGGAESDSFGEPADVRYVCEDLEDAGPLVRVLGRGYRLEGWRRGVLMGVMISSIAIAALIVIFLLLQMLLSKTLDGKQFANSLMALAVLGVAFWSTTGRILRLADRKIVLAPWWMQSVDDDRLLERREPPRFAGKSIKAVRYASKCPICRGKVTVRAGGIEFWGRLVGRCEHAPVEHIFSFDHVTRTGNPLRRTSS